MSKDTKSTEEKKRQEAAAAKVAAKKAPPEVETIKGRVKVAHNEPQPGGGSLARRVGTPLEVMPHNWTPTYYDRLTDEEYAEAIKNMKDRR